MTTSRVATTTKSSDGTPAKGAVGIRRVVLVDDHPIVRDGLRSMLRETEFQVCGEAESTNEAKTVLRECKPDVLVVDLTLRQGDGLDLVRDARARYPHLRILVLSMQDEEIYAERMIKAGANGYLMKRSAAADFLDAIRRVSAGQMFVSKEVQEQILDRAVGGRHQPSQIDTLSDRELQVLHLIGKGRSTQQVATELNLSGKTVESHRQRIKRKLSLETSAQLVQFAVNWASTKG